MITVRPARDKDDLEAWIQFPRLHVYSRTDPWVAPLDDDLRRLLDRSKNPFFRHGDAVPLLATDAQGDIVGRVLAHVYHRHNARHEERAAFFGYFECKDIEQAAQALIGVAKRVGARQYCTILRGPFNMTAMQEMGTLLEGFDQAPALDETYTPPYYPRLMEAAGLRTVFPHATYRVNDLSRVEPDSLLNRRHRESLADGRLRIRSANMKEYDREIDTLRDLLNDSFYDNPHFVPLTRDEFIFQLGPLRRLMDPAICLVAEWDGVPCGFIVAVPDFNLLLKPQNGKLGLLGLLRFIFGRAGIRDAVLIIMGVQRHLQGQGIMRVLQAELLRALRQRKYRSLTITWVAEGNAKSLATMKAIGAEPWHRLTLYEGQIASREAPQT